MALIISWMMFFMIGMFSISATCIKENLSNQSNRGVKNGQTEWPAKYWQDTWNEKEIAQQENQPASETWNNSIYKNQCSQARTEKESKTVSMKTPPMGVPKEMAKRLN